MQSGPYRLFVAVVLLVAVRSLSAQTLAYDLSGRAVSQLSAADTRAVVLIFAATDCPISNRYIPDVEHLRGEWQAKGVRFWWVFPNPDDTAARVTKHEHDFSIGTEALLDSSQNLVRMAHATVTPEAAVFTPRNGQLHEFYHGRIDDRYLAFGQERPQPTQHDLEAAIKAALNGAPAPHPAAGPVGCSIVPLHLKP